jgi:hypothetical protein
MTRSDLLATIADSGRTLTAVARGVSKDAHNGDRSTRGDDRR